MERNIRKESTAIDNRDITVAVLNLGCAKNQVDAELILGRLYHAGFSITNEASDADIIIVNSCGFIRPARTETIETINEMNRYREKGKLKKLIVSGCMAGNDRDKLLSANCRIDAFLPPFNPEAIVELINTGDIRNPGIPYCAPPILTAENRIITTSGAYAYVKIADGCDNRCAYCRIPHLRGSYRSKSPDRVIDEIKSLVKEGIREINIISQDNTLYGGDLGLKNGLNELISKIDALEGDFWFRLLYLHPDRVDAHLLETMASSSKLCRYLDMPLQHVSEKVLKRMNRRGNPDAIRKKLKMIKNQIPDLVLRTTLITGYPQETEEEFKELLNLVEEGWFHHLGVFTFQPEPDTLAMRYPNSISLTLAEDRRAELIEVQNDLLPELQSGFLGREFPMVVEFAEPENPGLTVARTEFQAPEVDSVVLVKGMYLPEESFISAVITDVDGTEWHAENAYAI